MSHYDIAVGDVIKYPEIVMARTVQNLFYCIICTNSRTVSRSYNRERYFCVSFGMFSESDVSITTNILGVSLFDKS